MRSLRHQRVHLGLAQTVAGEVTVHRNVVAHGEVLHERASVDPVADRPDLVEAQRQASGAIRPGVVILESGPAPDQKKKPGAL